MENGEIKEQGTHEELMTKRGLYYQLVTNQIFIDKDGPCPLEKARLSDAGTFQNLKRKKSSLHNLLKHQVSSLEQDLQEENIEPASGLRIIKESKKEWRGVVIGTLAATLTGGIMPTFAILYSEIFDTLSLTGVDLKNSAFFWSMMFLVLAGSAAVGHFFRFVGYSFASENMTSRLRFESFANILRQDIAWFDDQRHNSGKLASRLSIDIPLMQSATGFRIGLVLSSSVTLVTSIIIAFIFGWKLALALLVAMPILLASGSVQLKMLKGNQKRDAELMAKASEIASEAIENVKTVQGLTLEARFYERYVSNLLEPFTENKKKYRFYAVAYGFSQAIMFFIYAAAFRLGAYLISQNEMEAVNVYRVFFAMAFSSQTVGQWISFLPDYSKAKLSAGIIFHLINLAPNIDSKSKGGICPEVKGKIDFIDVKFRYPSRRSVQVLQGLSLSVNPGQTVALVGASGCGKSTVIALLERFYDPDYGQILMDGFDIKAMNLKHLRSQMALVSQEPVLFNCSIKENITYGIEDKISNLDIEVVARIANIHDFIKKLPQGYDTVVGERGTQLSGGQKQRIAIARALIRRPKILLLDEATSALDTESEKAVQDALDQARQGRTCIVIAHRLSTIQNADCIAVIDGGKIVEKGTHQELVNNKGIYYNLIKRQYK
ncbi:Phosphatidylcholine translocator ABCB4 [Araneus ventricosus]|uniref:ABC-type xenobiotic transporter n=1 Tax=Araneus ventricosus TaxID=182803 RepID=A0A4Y2LYP1_ARAVE|nr:Phosphatidylcholine translocator ABCB4 [Araneus ventricosus]